jgi:hypothetical protein
VPGKDRKDLVNSNISASFSFLKQHRVSQRAFANELASSLGNGATVKINDTYISRFKAGKISPPASLRDKILELLVKKITNLGESGASNFFASLNPPDRRNRRTRRNSTRQHGSARGESHSWFFGHKVEQEGPFRNFKIMPDDLRSLARKLKGSWFAIEYSKSAIKSGRRRREVRGYFFRFIDERRKGYVPFLVLGKNTKWHGGCYRLMSGKTELLYLVASVFERDGSERQGARELRDEVSLGVFYGIEDRIDVLSGITVSLAFGAPNVLIGATKCIMWRVDPKITLTQRSLGEFRKRYCRYLTSKKMQDHVRKVDGNNMHKAFVRDIRNLISRSANPLALIAKLPPTGEVH